MGEFNLKAECPCRRHHPSGQLQPNKPLIELASKGCGTEREAWGAAGRCLSGEISAKKMKDKEEKQYE